MKLFDNLYREMMDGRKSKNVSWTMLLRVCVDESDI